MSYSDEDEQEVAAVIPMPKNSIRFTDMPVALYEKAIRSKFPPFILNFTSL